MPRIDSSGRALGRENFHRLHLYAGHVASAKMARTVYSLADVDFRVMWRSAK